MPSDPAVAPRTTTTTTSTSLISTHQHSLVRSMLTALAGSTRRNHHHPPQGQVARSIMSRRFGPGGIVDEPPAYSRGYHRPVIDPVVQPATLLAAGRFIYSDRSPAPPLALYELSHDADFLSDSNRQVGVDRLDHALKLHDGGAPQPSMRSKHIYDLRHPGAITGPTFPFHADPTSRQSLGSLGITTFRHKRWALAKGYRVHRATRGPHHRLLCGQVLFTAVPSKDKAVQFEWFDSQERLVARELADSGGVKSLLISAEMSMRNRDALVVAWTLKGWWDLSREGSSRMSHCEAGALVAP
ncbi:hypothetical protein L249_4962 [Ophiocordyceps polyrhachis-furcata BCC 54312]|uniref:Uncharacterized protein n=1 Tax=Ophiocordyceps polyrhachis-furcata BCC 54312 TaxID=1330021 RepID=A0A367L3W1_9HYPO|nr:hypothetical protein L249_4962 [Ophiocordyceps polyrhachis-furcata BCC 54312]